MNRARVSVEEKLEGLSEDKAALLRLLLQEKSKQIEIRPLPRDPDPDSGKVRAPTSWAQQRLWFIDQLGAGNIANYVPVTMRFRGSLDQAALQNALDALVQRHETLRTVFIAVGGEPIQEIATST
jgi:hypothetical protein